MPIKITAISDLHGAKPTLPGGDLLIVAGDLTARDTEHEHFVVWRWLTFQKYRKIVVIAGNHDGYMVGNPDALTNGGSLCYLQDSGTEFEGLKIWGAPWTPMFWNWHFMLPPDELKAKWDLIPADTDILVTHGPPYGILDKCEISSKGDQFKHAGCSHLRDAVERVKPKLHVFGHIHEGYGKTILKSDGPSIGTICINASHMDQDYNPINPPITLEL